jgi:hypothetical protein
MIPVAVRTMEKNTFVLSKDPDSRALSLVISRAHALCTFRFQRTLIPLKKVDYDYKNSDLCMRIDGFVGKIRAHDDELQFTIRQADRKIKKPIKYLADFINREFGKLPFQRIDIVEKKSIKEKKDLTTLDLRKHSLPERH